MRHFILAIAIMLWGSGAFLNAQQQCGGCPASWDPPQLSYQTGCCTAVLFLSRTDGLCNQPPGCVPGQAPCTFTATAQCSGTCYVFVQAGGTWVLLPCGVPTNLGSLQCYNYVTVTFLFVDCVGNNTVKLSTATCGVCPI
jgi:hypothetical protein